MHNFIAVVFDDTSKAYKGLHALWQLDASGDITVHGTAVVHRTEWGQYIVDTKETSPVLATAVGVGIGALLGALAGPAGAAIGAAKGAGIGAASGAALGGAADVARLGVREQAGLETARIVGPGKSAVIAEVSEEWTTPVDTRMRELGGTVYRRSRSGLRDDAWYEDYVTPNYLYPYEYVPPAYSGP